VSAVVFTVIKQILIDSALAYMVLNVITLEYVH